MNETFEKLRRKIVVAKYTMSRGYIWCQTPTMALIAAGVLKPLLPNWNFWILAILGVVIFVSVGYIDRKLGFLGAEQSYTTEQNPLLMKGLFKKEKTK